MLELIQSFADIVRTFANILEVGTPIITIIGLAGLFATAYDISKKSVRRG